MQSVNVFRDDTDVTVEFIHLVVAVSYFNNWLFKGVIITQSPNADKLSVSFVFIYLLEVESYFKILLFVIEVRWTSVKLLKLVGWMYVLNVLHDVPLYI